MGAAPATEAVSTFDPALHEAELVAIIDAVVRAERLDARALNQIVKSHPRAGRGLFSKSQIIAGFRSFGGECRWPVDEGAFLERLRLRPVRTQSGVTPVTVLTRPHPCPGRCIFCPSDVHMPKSYLSLEPGAQRAADNAFDPYLQTWNRLDAFRSIGHPVDKVELIVLGGTWSAYPEAYQVWFAKRCFDALNDFGAGRDARGGAGAAPARYRRLTRSAGASYNQAVGRFLAGEIGGDLLHVSERARWEELEGAQRRNEGAGCRSVGFAVETRPDHVTEAEVLRLRRLGVTKVQIGVQHLSDRVLALNGRGHDVATTRAAFRLLRRAGFKLHAHWMANLRGSDPASDVEDFARLFADPDFRPDELKLYPCSLVESAELMDYYRRGAWRPYDADELLAVVTACMRITPPWCRLTRVIRDFSAGDIVAGNRVANLREVAEQVLADAGTPCRDIRSREIRGEPVERASLRLSLLEYATSAGDECFLQFTTPRAKLAGFLRLTLPSEPAFPDEIAGSALLREVHVYGGAVPLGRRQRGRAQHAGLGRALVEAAAARARDAGHRDLAVISAVGTRPYYRSLGFRDGALYQHLPLD